jgi:uncharacterized protein (TIGR03118 family)
VQTNLVSDIPGLAAHTDPNLHNPWGTPTGPGLPIWVSGNARGVTTLYDGAGNPQPGPKDQLVVTIPAPPTAGPGAAGAPTGTAFNPSSDGFVVTSAGLSGSSRFLFATEDGTGGFAPFGIHNIGDRLLVTFAKQDLLKHDDVFGDIVPQP